MENEEEEEEEEEEDGNDNGVIDSIRPSSLIAILSFFLTSPSYSPPSPLFNVRRERDSFIIGVRNNDDDDEDDEEEESRSSIDDDLNNFLLCECRGR